MNFYERVYGLLLELKMSPKQAKERGVVYDDPGREKRHKERTSSEGHVRGTRVIIRLGRTKKGRKRVRIKTAGEGDPLKRRKGMSQEELKASIISRVHRGMRKELAKAAAGVPAAKYAERASQEHPGVEYK